MFGHSAGAACPEASWANVGHFLPPGAIFPHLLQGNKLILCTGPQGQLFFISGGMGRKKCFNQLMGLRRGLGIGLREGDFGLPNCLSLTECPKESPGVSSVSGHL